MLDHPGDPFVLYKLGATLAKSGQAGEALELCCQGHVQAPDCAELLLLEAYLRHGAGQIGQAESLLRRCVALDRQQSAAWQMLGDLCLGQQRRAEAEGLAEQLEQQGMGVDAALLRGRLLISRRDPAAARGVAGASRRSLAC